jgi:hypothetical protein
MQNEKMKKLFMVMSIFSLLISSCQYIAAESATPSVQVSVSTDIPEIGVTLTPVNTKPLISTPAQVITPTSAIKSTLTPVPLPLVSPTAYPLILQFGSPVTIKNFIHTDEGCNWLGIAGQVFDSNNRPINNLVVNVIGKLGQSEIDKIAVTGIPEANVYGLGGYEIKIADKPVNSENNLRIQVFDLNGNSLSKPLSFNTSSDCSKNLIIINFQTK